MNAKVKEIIAILRYEFIQPIPKFHLNSIANIIQASNSKKLIIVEYFYSTKNTMYLCGHRYTCKCLLRLAMFRAISSEGILTKWKGESGWWSSGSFHSNNPVVVPSNAPKSPARDSNSGFLYSSNLW